MKNNKFNYAVRLIALMLLIIFFSVGFTNTSDDSLSKKVSVKIKIGNSSCTGSGICQITKVSKNRFSDVSGLEREFYGLIGTTWGGEHYVIQTRSDWMSGQTYTQYFAGENFVMENDFIITENTIGNKKAITLQSGSYPIHRDGETFKIEATGY